MKQFVTEWENEEIVRQRDFGKKVDTKMFVSNNQKWVTFCKELLCSCHICNDPNVKCICTQNCERIQNSLHCCGTWIECEL